MSELHKQSPGRSVEEGKSDISLWSGVRYKNKAMDLNCGCGDRIISRR